MYSQPGILLVEPVKRGMVDLCLPQSCQLLCRHTRMLAVMLGHIH